MLLAIFSGNFLMLDYPRGKNHHRYRCADQYFEKCNGTGGLSIIYGI